MLKTILTFFILNFCFIKTTTAQSVYTFIGNGNWNDPSNWENNIMPPIAIPNGSQIIINPAADGVCIVNIPVHIPSTAVLILLPEKKLNIIGGIYINYDPSADGLFIDPRDQQIYPFKHLGTQVWMTKNLNYYPNDFYSNSTWCYNIYPANCTKYGRLYSQYAAIAVPPPGWHLPSEAEWDTLINYLGGADIAGGAMKETSDWNLPNTGATNSSGFTALPGGSRIWIMDNRGLFEGQGRTGWWWSSSTLPGSFFSVYFSLSYNTTSIVKDGTDGDMGYSVRCIRD